MAVMAGSSNMLVKTEISNKCRICLHEGNISIYNRDYSESRLRDNICIFGDIEVRKDDIFPKHLCQSCFNALQAAIHFRRTAKETDRLLKLKSQSRVSKNMQVILNGTCSARKEKKKVILQNYSQTQLRKKKLESIPVQNGKLIISLSKSVQMQSTAVDIKEGSETDEEMLSTDDIQGDIKTEELQSTVDIRRGSMQDVNKECISKMKLIKYELECTQEAVKSDVTKPRSEESSVKKTNMTRFQGEVCNKSFQERKAYHKQGKSVQSAVQNISSQGSSSALQISSNQSEKLLVCDLCPRKFKQKNYLLIHKSMHEQKGPLIPYAKHFKFIGLVNNKPMVECQICEKTIQKISIRQHYNFLHKKTASCYLCDVCGKKLNCLSSLVVHKTTHTNEFLFKCKLCPYKGRHEGLLRVHMRRHLDKYLICDLCSNQFKHKSNLIRHIRRHYKPEHKCEICKRPFYEKSSLNSHFKLKHMGGTKPIPCELCDKVFNRRRALLRHQFKVHDRKKVGSGIHLAHYIKKQN